MHIRSKYTTWTFLLAFKFKSSPIPIHLLHRHPGPDGWNWCRFFRQRRPTCWAQLGWSFRGRWRLTPVRCFLGESELELDHFMLCAKTWKKRRAILWRSLTGCGNERDFMNPFDETSLRKRRVGLCFVEISSLKVWTTTWSHDCSPWRPGSC